MQKVMNTKSNKIKLKIRGVANSVYWALRLHAGFDIIKRTIDTTTAAFPVKNSSEGWTYWSHGGDLFGERAIIRDALQSVRPDDTFWDVGSGFGVYSAFLGQRCADVVAFEPNTDRVATINEVMKLNDISSIIRQHALGDQNGFAKLNEDMSITYLEELRQGVSGFDVHRGDAVAPDTLPTPDVMKIDTEGAELEVLRGMGDLLNDIRVLYVEPHPDKYPQFDTDWAEIEEYLSGFPFHIEPMKTDKENPIYRVSNPET